MNVNNNPFAHCSDPHCWDGASCPATGLCQFQPSLLPDKIKQLFDRVSPGFSKIADCQAFASWGYGGNCLCSTEGSPTTRIIDHHPGLFEVALGDEGAADSISCKSDSKKTDFLCTGSGMYSKYSVDMGQDYCIEHTTPSNDDDVENLAFCAKGKFILLDQLLHPSVSPSSESPQNSEPTSEAPKSNPKVSDFDWDASGKRSSNSSDENNLEICLHSILKEIFNDETRITKAIAKLAAKRFVNQSAETPEIEAMIANSITQDLRTGIDSFTKKPLPNILQNLDLNEIDQHLIFVIERTLQQCTNKSPTPTPTPPPKPKKGEKIKIKIKKRKIGVNDNPTPTPNPSPKPKRSYQKYGSKSNHSSNPQMKMVAGFATVTALLAYIGRELFKERKDDSKKDPSSPSKKSVPMRPSLTAKKL